MALHAVGLWQDMVGAGIVNGVTNRSGLAGENPVVLAI